MKVLLINGSPNKNGCTYTALNVIKNTLDEVLQDQEGLQIMRFLARNMAWMLKLQEVGDSAGVPLPKQEAHRTATNFIR